MKKDHIVLIADDDRFLRELIATELKLAGFSVLQACSGKEALKVFRKSALKPAVVILDLCMHNDGIATCQTFKSDPFMEGDRPKIILWSASQKEKFFEMARRVGADTVLRKPVQVKELKQAILELTGGQSAQPDPTAQNEAQKATAPEELVEKPVRRVVSDRQFETDPVEQDIALLFKLPQRRSEAIDPASMVLFQSIREIIEHHHGSECKVRMIDANQILVRWKDRFTSPEAAERKARQTCYRIDGLLAGVKLRCEGEKTQFSGISKEALTRLLGRPAVDGILEYLRGLLGLLSVGQQGLISTVFPYRGGFSHERREKVSGMAVA